MNSWTTWGRFVLGIVLSEIACRGWASPGPGGDKYRGIRHRSRLLEDLWRFGWRSRKKTRHRVHVCVVPLRALDSYGIIVRNQGGRDRPSSSPSSWKRKKNLERLEKKKSRTKGKKLWSDPIGKREVIRIAYREYRSRRCEDPPGKWEDRSCTGRCRYC